MFIVRLLVVLSIANSTIEDYNASAKERRKSKKMPKCSVRSPDKARRVPRCAAIRVSIMAPASAGPAA